MNHIVVIGSANIDFTIRSEVLPRPGQTVIGSDVVVTFGGKGANQAVAASRLGGKVEFLARLGNDDYGAQYMQRLKDEEIDLAYVQRSTERPNGCAMIVVDAGGENMIVVSPGSNAEITPADIEAASKTIQSASAIVLQFEIPIPAVNKAVEIANRAGVPVILNPSPWNPEFHYDEHRIDYLVINCGEAESIAGFECRTADTLAQAAAIIREQGVHNVIVTRGGEPTFVSSGSRSFHVPAVKVDVVDTVGAGDTFTGALAVGIAELLPLSEAVRFANAAASIATTKLGAQTSMPRRSEVSVSQDT